MSKNSSTKFSLLLICNIANICDYHSHEIKSHQKRSWFTLQKVVNEPPHDKTNKIICASTKDSDQPGQSDQSLRCPHDERLGP